jgi:ribosomal protein L18E
VLSEVADCRDYEEKQVKRKLVTSWLQLMEARYNRSAHPSACAISNEIARALKPHREPQQAVQASKARRLRDKNTIVAHST